MGNVQADSSFLVQDDRAGKQELLNIEYRILAGSLSRSADIDTILEDIFRPAKDTASRAMHYRAITAAMRANLPTPAAQKYLDGKLLGLSDQLNNFIGAVQSEDEARSLLELVLALMQCESEAFRSRFEHSLPKVAAAATSLTDNEGMRRFGFQVLQAMLESEYRSCCQHQFGAIRTASFARLDAPEAGEVAADCAALTMVGDNTENWMNFWNNYVYTVISVVQSMGIAQNLSLPAGAKLFRDMNLSELSGTAKAVFSERTLGGCLQGLQRMLYHGCATGPVHTDFRMLFACCHAVVSVQTDLGALADPKYLVENDSGLSLADFSLVLNNIKISIMEVTRFVVTVTPPTTLYPVAGFICRSVAAAAASRDCHTSPRLSAAVYAAAVDAIASFPTAIVKVIIPCIFYNDYILIFYLLSIQTGMFVETILNQFKASMRLLTVLPDGVHADVPKSLLLMKVVQQVLLFCGSILPTDQRRDIEFCIAVGLACLSKGVCTSSCAVLDRKIRRVGSVDRSGITVSSGRSRLTEPLRRSIEAQIGLLQLAAAEVLCPVSTGSLSGNIALAKIVAENMSTHVNVECRSEARYALAVIDNILHPSAIALPAVSAATLIKSHIAERGMGETTEMMLDDSSNHYEVSVGNDLYSAENAGNAPEIVIEAVSSAPKVAAQSADDEKAAPAATVMKAPFAAKSSLLTSGGPSAKEINPTISGVKRPLPAEDSDSDMDLPDINMD